MDYSRTSQERAILKAHNNAVERHWLYFNRKATFKGKTKKNDPNCSTCKENREKYWIQKLEALLFLGNFNYVYRGREKTIPKSLRFI